MDNKIDNLNGENVMNMEEFLLKMYFEYGKVPELVKRYIDNELEYYSHID